MTIEELKQQGWLSPDEAKKKDQYIIDLRAGNVELQNEAKRLEASHTAIESKLQSDLAALGAERLRLEAEAACMRGILHLAKEMTRPGFHANPYRGLEHTHFDLHAGIEQALSTHAGKDLLLRLERYEQQLAVAVELLDSVRDFTPEGPVYRPKIDAFIAQHRKGKQ